MKQKWMVITALCVLMPVRAARSDAPPETNKSDAPVAKTDAPKTDAPTAAEVAKAQADAAEARAEAAEAKAQLLKLQAGQGGAKTEAAPADAPAASVKKVELAEGTKLRLQVTEDLASNKSQVGEEVRYCVADDVLGPNKEVLIKKGARATGKVTRAKGAGGFGRGGKLEFTVDSVVAADGTSVPLRGRQENNGKSSKGSMAAVAIFVTPLGFFMKGHNITVKQGTEIDAWINNKAEIAVPTSGGAKAVNEDQGK